MDAVEALLALALPVANLLGLDRAFMATVMLVLEVGVSSPQSWVQEQVSEPVLAMFTMRQMRLKLLQAQVKEPMLARQFSTTS